MQQSRKRQGCGLSVERTLDWVSTDARFPRLCARISAFEALSGDSGDGLRAF